MRLVSRSGHGNSCSNSIESAGPGPGLSNVSIRRWTMEKVRKPTNLRKHLRKPFVLWKIEVWAGGWGKEKQWFR